MTIPPTGDAHRISQAATWLLAQGNINRRLVSWGLRGNVLSNINALAESFNGPVSRNRSLFFKFAREFFFVYALYFFVIRAMNKTCSYN